MCYYNSLKTGKDQAVQLRDQPVPFPGPFVRPVQSGFDFDSWPILRPKEGGKGYEIVMAHWELIAPWIRNREDLEESRKKYTALNAIGEKMLESRLYKEAALKRRCLVLSSGFYEWRHIKLPGSKKEQAFPYHIIVPGKPIFFMAGIWQDWTDQETGEMVTGFAILTTAANKLMEQVHNKKKRMPVILDEDRAVEWLETGLPAQRITELGTWQFPSEKMRAYTVVKEFKVAMDPEQEVAIEGMPALEV
ncbi:SOS response-associated peptidase [Flavihumibacter rivuli]|uniref:SOS response-associated peptidase n=1 Tax=Flavihumibacter rivuli TaxID=2838156 RepID=UPI001BDF6BA8|nr:SOS response-associated peptidase [Flavihumibacter rivuli]ULQ57355.1 SOS response-associated peptidase [Flavihumibacter rivuli]